jgi:hypothetical protein
MTKNKMPEFGSIQDLVDYFDTHDMGEFFDEMPEAHFDVDIHRRCFLVAVDKKLMKKLAAAANARHTTTSKLVNAWLEEKTTQAV